LVCFVVRISKISVKSDQFLLDYSNFNQSINHCVYFRLKTHKNRDSQRQTDNHKKHTTQKWDKNTHKTRQSQTQSSWLWLVFIKTQCRIGSWHRMDRQMDIEQTDDQ